VIVMMRHNRRSFVDRLDFRTSVGFGDGPSDRARLGLTGAGPSVVITDLGLLHPDPHSRELTLTHLHPGVAVDQVVEATGWPLAVSADLHTTDPPTPFELDHLRRLAAAKAAPGGRPDNRAAQ
jgi:glutaconate CoA-transferase subunit B